jgi:hypothetical protein
MRNVQWQDEPDEHDYPAAASYLALIADPDTVSRLVKGLKKAPIAHAKAKDILRASGLPDLPLDNVHVAKDARQGQGRHGPVPGPARARERCAGDPAADRRRLPPRVRELSPRRGHRHPLSDGWVRLIGSRHSALMRT